MAEPDVVLIPMPVYGMGERASIDFRSWLVLFTVLSRASEHDTNYFQSVVIKSIHTREMRRVVYADKGYRSPIVSFSRPMILKTGSCASMREYEAQRD